MQMPPTAPTMTPTMMVFPPDLPAKLDVFESSYDLAIKHKIKMTSPAGQINTLIEKLIKELSKFFS